MTVCGIKRADGVCVMGKCKYLNLCKDCVRQNLCGDEEPKYYCTGYMQTLPTKWTNRVQDNEEKKE